MKLLNIKFIKFCIVGSFGAITNIILFYIFVDILGFNKFIIASLNFFICVTQNYILNHFWTFNELMKNNKLSFLKYFKFILTSLFGFVINICILKIITLFKIFPLHTISHAIGIFAGMIFNFLGSSLFVFMNKQK